MKNVGHRLGLKEDSASTPDIFISNWLGAKDYVRNDSGAPSWESLAAALLYNGHTEIASKIRKGEIIILSSSNCYETLSVFIDNIN